MTKCSNSIGRQRYAYRMAQDSFYRAKSADICFVLRRLIEQKIILKAIACRFPGILRNLDWANI